jgi:hypothetical protein
VAEVVLPTRWSNGWETKARDDTGTSTSEFTSAAIGTGIPWVRHAQDCIRHDYEAHAGSRTWRRGPKKSRMVSDDSLTPLVDL